jgi:hypothetical protein
MSAPDTAPVSPPSAAQPDADRARPGGSGRDIGLALACLGLLLAAAVLGLSDDGRKATRSSRDRMWSVLRPLLGRR